MFGHTWHVDILGGGVLYKIYNGGHVYLSPIYETFMSKISIIYKHKQHNMKGHKLAYCSECLNLIGINQDKVQFCTNCEKEVKVLIINHDK